MDDRYSTEDLTHKKFVSSQLKDVLGWPHGIAAISPTPHEIVNPKVSFRLNSDRLKVYN
jgi:hypothetical protein